MIIGADVAQHINEVAYLPTHLSIRYSLIKNAGLGVFANREIKQGEFLGNYVGVLTKTKCPGNFYVFSTEINGVAMYIDAQDMNKSNWTRFMNSATSSIQENVSAIRCNSANIINIVSSDGTPKSIDLNGLIMFVAKTDIAIEEELLYSYGSNFNEHLM
jgi:hypothetical protein